MKILHLLSNYKLTGPSEPVINLVNTQKQLGADVILASSRYTKGDNPNQVADAAAERGISPYLGLYLSKHRNPFYNVRDIAHLAHYLHNEQPDVVHCHLNNDHFIAWAACSLLKRKPALIRTLYTGSLPPKNIFNRILLNNTSLHLVVPSQTVKKRLVNERGFNDCRIHLVDPAIDTDRFDPGTCGPDKRADFRLSPDDFVVGIVARVQWHRRFPELLEGVRLAAAEVSNLRLLIVGRGTNIEEIAVKPVSKMGLDTVVSFTGYQTGNDYVRTLKSFDAKIFLMPGTDGTCRAVLESLCMGKPVIAARRGILPNLVEDGSTGLVIDDSPKNIAKAIITLAQDRDRCRQMGRRAHTSAKKRFSLSSQADETLSIYAQLRK
jgi:glycosyltransferase involved in cell wall biosynthesis